MGILNQRAKKWGLYCLLFAVLLYFYRLLFWWWTTRTLRALSPASRLDLLYSPPSLLFFVALAFCLAGAGYTLGLLLDRFSH